MTLKQWLVLAQNNGVIDPFLKGHGDSRYLYLCIGNLSIQFPGTPTCARAFAK